MSPVGSTNNTPSRHDDMREEEGDAGREHDENRSSPAINDEVAAPAPLAALGEQEEPATSSRPEAQVPRPNEDDGPGTSPQERERKISLDLDEMMKDDVNFPCPPEQTRKIQALLFESGENLDEAGMKLNQMEEEMLDHEEENAKETSICSEKKNSSRAEVEAQPQPPPGQQDVDDDEAAPAGTLVRDEVVQLVHEKARRGEKDVDNVDKDEAGTTLVHDEVPLVHDAPWGEQQQQEQQQQASTTTSSPQAENNKAGDEQGREVEEHLKSQVAASSSSTSATTNDNHDPHGTRFPQRLDVGDIFGDTFSSAAAAGLKAVDETEAQITQQAEEAKRSREGASCTFQEERQDLQRQKEKLVLERTAWQKSVCASYSEAQRFQQDLKRTEQKLKLQETHWKQQEVQWKRIEEQYKSRLAEKQAQIDEQRREIATQKAEVASWRDKFINKFEGAVVLQERSHRAPGFFNNSTSSAAPGEFFAHQSASASSAVRPPALELKKLEKSREVVLTIGVVEKIAKEYCEKYHAKLDRRVEKLEAFISESGNKMLAISGEQAIISRQGGSQINTSSKSSGSSAMLAGGSKSIDGGAATLGEKSAQHLQPGTASLQNAGASSGERRQLVEDHAGCKVLDLVKKMNMKNTDQVEKCGNNQGLLVGSSRSTCEVVGVGVGHHLLQEHHLHSKSDKTNKYGADKGLSSKEAGAGSEGGGGTGIVDESSCEDEIKESQELRSRQVSCNGRRGRLDDEQEHGGAQVELLPDQNNDDHEPVVLAPSRQKEHVVGHAIREQEDVGLTPSADDAIMEDVVAPSAASDDEERSRNFYDHHHIRTKQAAQENNQVKHVEEHSHSDDSRSSFQSDEGSREVDRDVVHHDDDQDLDPKQEGAKEDQQHQVIVQEAQGHDDDDDVEEDESAEEEEKRRLF
ncbi:unnamed protein product [Amoebophrya sp. A120]|nr:unnamed protein product [Amoebophrya sp. A120]|eukprot:GSA120T00013676001.1